MFRSELDLVGVVGALAQHDGVRGAFCLERFDRLPQGRERVDHGSGARVAPCSDGPRTSTVIDRPFKQRKREPVGTEGLAPFVASTKMAVSGVSYNGGFHWSLPEGRVIPHPVQSAESRAMRTLERMCPKKQNTAESNNRLLLTHHCPTEAHQIKW